MACGTGACASAAASYLAGFAGTETRVTLLGGGLDIAWELESGHICMCGPATEVFHGEINIEEAQ